MKDFGFFIFYSVDGNISQKAMMIELLFVLLNYWSLVLFSFIFRIIFFVNSIYFEVFFFNFGDFVNIDFIHLNVVNSTCWLNFINNFCMKKKNNKDMIPFHFSLLYFMHIQQNIDRNKEIYGLYFWGFYRKGGFLSKMVSLSMLPEYLGAFHLRRFGD